MRASATALLRRARTALTAWWRDDLNPVLMIRVPVSHLDPWPGPRPGDPRPTGAGEPTAPLAPTAPAGQPAAPAPESAR